MPTLVPSIAEMNRTNADTGPAYITVSGNYAYITGETSNTFSIYDISNPSSIILKSTKTTGSSPFGIAVSGNYAYITTFGAHTLEIWDISDPLLPVQKSVTSIDGGSVGFTIIIQGHYAYMTSYTSGNFIIYDVSNPLLPVLQSNTHIGSMTYGITVSSNYAYVTTYSNNSLLIYDISDPTLPALRSNTIGSSTQLLSPLRSGAYLYITTYAGNSLVIYDVSDPTSPIFKSDTPTDVNCDGIAILNGYIYVTSATGNTIKAVDVSNPLLPVIVSSQPTGADPTFLVADSSYLYSVSFTPSYMYVYTPYFPLAKVLSTVIVGSSYVSQSSAPGDGYIYFWDQTFPTSKLWRYKIADDTYTNILSLAGWDFDGLVIDLAGDKLYFSGTQPGGPDGVTVYKYTLSTLSFISSTQIVSSSHTTFLQADFSGGFLYTASAGIVYKINTATLSFTTSINFTSSKTTDSILDVINGYFYTSASDGADIGKVFRINTTSLAISSLLVTSGNPLAYGALDSTHGFLYYPEYSISISLIHKLSTSSFTEVGTFTPPPDTDAIFSTNYSASLDQVFYASVSPFSIGSFVGNTLLNKGMMIPVADALQYQSMHFIGDTVYTISDAIPAHVVKYQVNALVMTNTETAQIDSLLLNKNMIQLSFDGILVSSTLSPIIPITIRRNSKTRRSL